MGVCLFFTETADIWQLERHTIGNKIFHFSPLSLTTWKQILMLRDSILICHLHHMLGIVQFSLAYPVALY